MSNVSCNTIRDILPLYADEVVSEDTCNLVAEHLERCAACRHIYESMKSTVSIPIEYDEKPLRNFRKAWKKEKIIIASVSVVLTLIILFTGYLVYQNVGVVHDFFSPAITVTMRNAASPDEWQRLDVGETGFLVFDSIFFSKEVILDGNCDQEASLRIRDRQGSILVDDLTLQPGTGALLDKLEKNVNYIVEIKTSGKFICIRFA